MCIVVASKSKIFHIIPNIPINIAEYYIFIFLSFETIVTSCDYCFNTQTFVQKLVNE